MKQALVIGGSMAGLFAARVLAEHFEQVTIIERDTLPTEPEFRSGVPQGRHAHALLSTGQNLAEKLFPGITAELTSRGSPFVEWAWDTITYIKGKKTLRFKSGIKTNLIYRVSFEWLIRQRLSSEYKVTFLSEHDVEGLITDADGSTVIGVNASSRADHSKRAIFADLVVDASGRNSKAPEWLQNIGYAEVEETQVNAYIGYATRIFEKPTNGEEIPWKVLYAIPSPEVPRGAVLLEIENNKWMLTLGGMNKDYPPTDGDGFLEYARTLATPDVYEAVKNATPVSAVHGYRIQGSRWRRYEKLNRFPERFILLGDSVCSFNPLYGQGITVAAMEANALQQHLANHKGILPKGFSAEYQRIAAKTLSFAWLMATGEDLRYPATEGAKPDAIGRMTQRYMDALLPLVATDEDIALAFFRVMNLETGAAPLMKPRILWRVLKHALSNRRSAQPHLSARQPQGV